MSPGVPQFPCSAPPRHVTEFQSQPILCLEPPPCGRNHYGTEKGQRRALRLLVPGMPSMETTPGYKENSRESCFKGRARGHRLRRALEPLSSRHPALPTHLVCSDSSGSRLCARPHEQSLRSLLLLGRVLALCGDATCSHGRHRSSRVLWSLRL